VFVTQQVMVVWNHVIIYSANSAKTRIQDKGLVKCISADQIIAAVFMLKHCTVHKWSLLLWKPGFLTVCHSSWLCLVSRKMKD